MKKGQLQQRTLDSYFKSVANPSAPVAPSPHAANAPASSVVQVDVMNEVLHSAATPAPAPPSSESGRRCEQTWLVGKETVVFPWSPLATYAGPDGQQAQSWDAIQRVLRASTPVRTSADLCDLLRTLERIVDGEASSYAHLRRTLDAMQPVEQQHVYQEVLPWMMETVLHAPLTLAGRTLPLLRQGTTHRLTLSHEEVVLLMCCCFFSLFPERSEGRRSPHDGNRPEVGKAQAATHSAVLHKLYVSRKLPSCNFSSLFSCTASGRDSSIASKIRCFLNYYICCQRHHGQPSSPAHQRCLELTRVCGANLPDFDRSTRPLCDVSVCCSGGIEEDAGALQVDFANRFVGGGVLRSGCVQEEIRMALAPEMVVSRVFCEELAETEVLFISGAPNFSSAVGYAEGFRHRSSCDPWGPQTREALEASVAAAPPLVDAAAPHPRTGAAMLLHDVCVLAMDAYNFRVRGQPSTQFQVPFLHREVRKAYVGFHGVAEPFAALPVVRRGAIATGNWGCGAFCGDVELKLVLQWCAASEAGGRTLHYYTFGKPIKGFDALAARLRADGCMVGRLMRALAQYSKYRDAAANASAPLSPLEFLAENACTTEVS